MTITCQLQSLGAFVPEDVLSNADFEKIVDTSDQWIVERTGIRQRHIIAAGDNTSDLGYRAAADALQNAGISASDLTHVIAATCTPDQLSPSVACIVAGKLEANNVMAFDMQAACTGFIYGLSICKSIILADPAAVVLLICAEALTRRVNWQDRNTCILFGDGATACVFSASGPGLAAVEDVICRSEGKQKDLIVVGGGTACGYKLDDPVDDCFFLTMQGRDTYKFAVRAMVDVCREILEKNNLAINDIDLFVPHQANMRIIEAVGSRLNISPEKVFTNVAEYGNTSAASIPLALWEAKNQGFIKTQSRVLVSAFGAGLTWGAALLNF